MNMNFNFNNPANPCEMTDEDCAGISLKSVR